MLQKTRLAPNGIFAEVLFDAMPIGLLVCDEAGRLVQVNAELLRLFGYAEHELLGEPVEILLPDAVRSGHPVLVRDYLAKPQRRAMGAGRELRGRRKDGSVFPLEIALNPVQAEERTLVLATVADITERRRLQDNFRRMVDTAPVGMLTLGGDGRIAHCNQALLEIFGYRRDEVEGESLEMLLPQRYRPGHGGFVEKFRQAPTSRIMGQGRDLTGLHKSGLEFHVEIGLNPMPTENGMALLATVSDISARKRAELRLNQLNADLEEFTYVASHDLRSPLRGISNLVEWVQEDLGEQAPEDVRNNLDRIHVRVARMEKLVDDLLSYARSGQQDRKVTTVDIDTLLKEVVDFVDPPAGFSVEVQVGLASLRTIHTTPTPLETVLRNLVSNAIKHHDRSEGKVLIKVGYEGTSCLFEVIDDGPGIPQSAHERVFKLFQTLGGSKEEGRSGVGLAVCKRLIEGHGGRVELLSDPAQRGSNFRFWWPRFARRDIHE